MRYHIREIYEIKIKHLHKLHAEKLREYQSNHQEFFDNVLLMEINKLEEDLRILEGELFELDKRENNK